MKRETYLSTCNDFIHFSPFEEKTNLLLKEQKKFREKLLQMKKSNLISEEVYNKLKPVDSQPARFFAPAKVHKENTPIPPVAAMPGSTHHALAAEFRNYLRKLPAANINTNVEKVQETLKELSLDDDEDIISLDLVSLFTNVPEANAIKLATEKMYVSDCVRPTSLPENTFKMLRDIVSIAVLFF